MIFLATDTSDTEISDVETQKKQIPTYLNIPKVPKASQITITVDKIKRNVAWPDYQNGQRPETHTTNKNTNNGQHSSSSSACNDVDTVQRGHSKPISSIANKTELWKARENRFAT